MSKDYPCANYYGHIHCSNRVTGFGDRCKLCTLMNEGASMNPDLLNREQRFHGVPLDSSHGHSQRHTHLVASDGRAAHMQHA
ncbi:hypothetical protein Cpir12675_005490 [Ceratocystis pirilliformis]|uniref:Uncharacterized protein n=2 Tax=Ceratocystis TaxID=5157 RepID=A0A2C5XID3_9PEZI|nr:hypothetical protein CFIMG_001381RA [Ceratocystis fimbriata CBS 114723]